MLTCALSLTDSVPTALAVYESVRKERAERIQNSAAVTRKALHLPDGEEQRKRDEAIRGSGKNPDLWADPSWQEFMWGPYHFLLYLECTYTDNSRNGCDEGYG